MPDLESRSEILRPVLPLAIVASRPSCMIFIRLCQKRRGAHASRALGFVERPLSNFVRIQPGHEPLRRPKLPTRTSGSHLQPQNRTTDDRRDNR